MALTPEQRELLKIYISEESTADDKAAAMSLLEEAEVNPYDVISARVDDLDTEEGVLTPPNHHTTPEWGRFDNNGGVDIGFVMICAMIGVGAIVMGVKHGFFGFIFMLAFWGLLALPSILKSK